MTIGPFTFGRTAIPMLATLIKFPAAAAAAPREEPALPRIGETVGWPLDLFEFPASKDPKKAIDLTGREKTLIYGPYLALPPGSWQANIRFLLDPEGGASHLRFDWGSAAIYESHCPVIDRPGEYEVVLRAEWGSDQLAELRAFACRPAFQGRITFLACAVTRLA